MTACISVIPAWVLTQTDLSGFPVAFWYRWQKTEWTAARIGRIAPSHFR
jgi:hypothetical protein